MGEIPGNAAEYLKRQYISAYEDTRTKIKTNFEDMDLDNALLRDEIENLVEEAEQLCKKCEAEVSGFSFS